MAVRLSVCASILKNHVPSHCICYVPEVLFFGGCGGGRAGLFMTLLFLLFIFAHLFVVTAVQRECMLTMH